MEAIGNIKTVVIRAPQVPSTPVLPAASRQPSLPVLGGGDSAFDAPGAEAARLDALRAAARNAPQPLGTQAVTMFKDQSGQVITRFRDTTSGKVTYIPEPDLLSMTRARAAQAVSLLNITA